MDIAAEVLALEERSVDESSAIIVRSTSHRWRIRWKRIQDDRGYTDDRHAIAKPSKMSNLEDGKMEIDVVSLHIRGYGR